MSLKKKIQLEVGKRRKAEDFFGRVSDIFPRKFDGFPASAPNVSDFPDPSNVGMTPAEEIVLDPSGYLVSDRPACSGSNEEILTRVCPPSEDCYYELPVGMSYITKAWFNGHAVISGLDYTITGDRLYPVEPLSSSAIVVIEFV